jgi:hypothetical protein
MRASGRNRTSEGTKTLRDTQAALDIKERRFPQAQTGYVEAEMSLHVLVPAITTPTRQVGALSIQLHQSFTQLVHPFSFHSWSPAHHTLHQPKELP